MNRSRFPAITDDFLAFLEEKMASPIVIPISSTKFQLDKTIVAPGGSVTVDVGASTDHDVLDAILENKPFPERPDGKDRVGQH